MLALSGGCSSSSDESVPAVVWIEAGHVDGAKAGEVAAWDYWNGLVEEYDGLFAPLIARSSPEIDPARARFVDWVVLESTSGSAVVEESVWMLDGPQLVPYGVRGFSSALSVRYTSAVSGGAPAFPGFDVTDRDDKDEDGDSGDMKLYRDAYASAWEETYARTLHERELALEKWLDDRIAVYHADVLIAGGRVVAPRVEREPVDVPYNPERSVERREAWSLSGGVFSSSVGSR